MIIERIINNNVVSSRDKDGKEVVIMGSGIGFGRKKGDAVAEQRIEKIFRMEDADALSRFKNLLTKLPMEYIQLSNEIISCAKSSLGTQLNENVYLTLTDHISFALERYKEGMFFPNALHHEVKRFYTSEYQVGLQALKLIQEKTGIVLPEDEAASIALHLVNAEFDLKVHDTWHMTNMISKMLEVLTENYPVLEKESLEKDRMISELKFTAYRILMLEPLKEKGDIGLSAFLAEHCPKAVKAAKAAAAAVQQEHGCRMTEEEMLYLAVYLKRIEDLYQA